MCISTRASRALRLNSIAGVPINVRHVNTPTGLLRTCRTFTVFCFVLAARAHRLDRRRARRSYSHSRPGVDYRLLFITVLSEKVAGGAYRPIRRGLEVRLRTQPLRQRLVPDLTGLLPGVAPDGRRRQVECVIRNSGVDVNAAVVLGRVDMVGHVLRLGRSEEHTSELQSLTKLVCR